MFAKIDQQNHIYQNIINTCKNSNTKTISLDPVSTVVESRDDQLMNLLQVVIYENNLKEYPFCLRCIPDFRQLFHFYQNTRSLEYGLHHNLKSMTNNIIDEAIKKEITQLSEKFFFFSQRSKRCIKEISFIIKREKKIKVSELRNLVEKELGIPPLVSHFYDCLKVVLEDNSYFYLNLKDNIITCE